MKIFIDPGHGGNDPGAVGINGTYESNVVLGIALELGKILENRGFQTEFSRTENETVSLSERAEMANKTDADLLISIHCNGFINSAASGVEVYSFPGNTKGGQLAKILSEKISAKFALKNRGAKTENFAVLRLSKMPAVLIETAFITNAAEEDLMNSPGFSREMANTIAESVADYFGINPTNDTAPHWAKTHLDNLVRKGYINSPDQWSKYEEKVSIAMVLALIDKITEEIK